MAELRIAERECPFGEAAQTARALFLAAVIRQAMAGSKASTRDARNAAVRVLKRLLDE